MIKILKVFLKASLLTGIFAMTFLFYIRRVYRGMNNVSADIFSLTNMKAYTDSVESDKVKNEVVSSKAYNKDIINNNVKLEDGIAILRINSCGVYALITEGTDNSVLRYSVGHFKDTPLPSEGGNFCICGHSSVVYDQLLNGLHDINIGDKIEIITKDKTYVYYAKETKIIMPSALYVLRNTDESQITILTCAENGTKRLCVVGTAKKVKKQSTKIVDSEKTEMSKVSYQIYTRLKSANLNKIGYFSVRCIKVRLYTTLVEKPTYIYKRQPSYIPSGLYLDLGINRNRSIRR